MYEMYPDKDLHFLCRTCIQNVYQRTIHRDPGLGDEREEEVEGSDPEIPTDLQSIALSYLICSESLRFVAKATIMNNTEVFAPVGDAGPFAMRGHKQRCMSAMEPVTSTDGDFKDEEQDRFLGVPLRRYCPTRSSAHIRDSFRRHSWEPGKRLQEEESNYDELSLSLKGLDPEEIEEAMGYRRDPRRTPITCSNDELENLLLMRGEDVEVTQEEHAKRLRAYLSSQNYVFNALSKSVSMTGIDHCYPDDVSLYSHGQRLTNG
ncbi:PREDICTED: uncharacterized protein LOC108798802, partial [Nanorana parkeri]|uniref:uncharacterized protein LOC108798802 n=1 Tax=Nanorana parkeri TaxID=125878 RepID=UPI0008545686